MNDTLFGLEHFHDTSALAELKQMWLERETASCFIRLSDGSYYQIDAKGYAPLGHCESFEEKAEKLKKIVSNGLYLTHFSKPTKGFDSESLYNMTNGLHDYLITNVKASGMTMLASYIYWPESYHRHA